jgi:hypothetical protein
MVIPSEVVNNEEQLTSWGRPQFHSCTLLCRSCKRYPAYLLQLHSVLEEPHGGPFRGLQATVCGTAPFKNRGFVLNPARQFTFSISGRCPSSQTQNGHNLWGLGLFLSLGASAAGRYRAVSECMFQQLLVVTSTSFGLKTRSCQAPQSLCSFGTTSDGILPNPVVLNFKNFCHFYFYTSLDMIPSQERLLSLLLIRE